MLCEVLSSDQLDLMRSVLGNAEECLTLELLYVLSAENKTVHL